jgi:hypothetical protein
VPVDPELMLIVSMVTEKALEGEAKWMMVLEVGVIGSSLIDSLLDCVA